METEKRKKKTIKNRELGVYNQYYDCICILNILNDGIYIAFKSTLNSSELTYFDAVIH